MNSGGITILLSSAIGLVQRLAGTIPSLSSSASATTSTTATTNNSTANAAQPPQELRTQLITNITTPQTLQDLIVLTVIVVFLLEILNQLVYHVPSILHNLRRKKKNKTTTTTNKKKKSIPVRGKHLDHFTIKDYTFITINKCMTGLFVYCYFGYLWSVRKLQQQQEEEEENSEGQHHHYNDHEEGGGQGIFLTADLSITNTLLPLPLLFLIYDFFYTLLHWGLHMKSVYAYVHKHHHFQKAPSRANIDAVNVHPLEFFLGEFNHILALVLVLKGVKVPTVVGGGEKTVMALLGYRGMDVSWVCAVLFIGLGGVLAGLNHTRHDVVMSVPSSTTASPSSSETDDATTTTTSNTTTTINTSKGYLTIFDSKHHDVHHRIPQSNYGQYTVFWDRLFGTFRDYDENDRVNPAYQLDPLTGKTVIVGKKMD